MTTTTTPNPDYKRGDVVLLLFPNSDLQTAKSRPALVVQADNLDSGLPQVIACMITSRMFRAGHPSRVAVYLATPEGKQSGLLSDSVVMTDNLATVASPAVQRVIGMLPMSWVDSALRHTLGSLIFSRETMGIAEVLRANRQQVIKIARKHGVDRDELGQVSGREHSRPH